MISNSPISDFQKKEIISPASIPTKNGKLLEVDVPLSLPERRIYIYLETSPSSATACLIDAVVRAYRNGRPVGVFPCMVADFTAQSPNESSTNLFNSGGSPVGDSLVLKLAQPFDAAVVSVVIQPLRINAEVDKVALELSSVRGATVTGLRAFLGVLSTKY
jgi:hypothetical protein